MTSTPVTVITGASRGIGAATALRLGADWHRAGNSATLILSYLSQAEAAEAVANTIRSETVKVVTVQADVSKEADVLRLFATADDNGQIVGLVNNAGWLGTIKPFTDYSIERIEQTMAVNVIGPFLCAREAVSRMLADARETHSKSQTGRSIVNVSSRAASFGSPNEFIDYAASKGAVDTMTIGLATEVAERNIRVNAVRPGLIHTDIHAMAGAPDRVERLAGRVPIGRGGTPEEVAASIAWLLSSEASYVTGALLDVGGGR